MSQVSNPWERKHAELRKKDDARTRAGILQSGLLTSRRSAQFQRFSAAFVMLPTGTEGAVMVAVESQAGETLFIGQPGYPVATSTSSHGRRTRRGANANFVTRVPASGIRGGLFLVRVQVLNLMKGSEAQ